MLDKIYDRMMKGNAQMPARGLRLIGTIARGNESYSVTKESLLYSFALRLLPRRKPTRKGGRVVECAGLEIQYTFMRIEGSNPSLSAKWSIKMRLFRRFFVLPINTPIKNWCASTEHTSLHRAMSLGVKYFFSAFLPLM